MIDVARLRESLSLPPLMVSKRMADEINAVLGTAPQHICPRESCQTAYDGDQCPECWYPGLRPIEEPAAPEPVYHAGRETWRWRYRTPDGEPLHNEIVHPDNAPEEAIKGADVCYSFYQLSVPGTCHTLAQQRDAQLLVDSCYVSQPCPRCGLSSCMHPRGQ